MATVDLGSFTRDGKLQIARALAIEAYANLEQSLCHLFGILMGSPTDKAAIVYFKLYNASVRNKIIEELLEKAHHSKFDIFWHGQPGQSGVPKIPGLFTHIRQLDEKRNQIIHWHVVRDIRFEGENYVTQENLTPPNI